MSGFLTKTVCVVLLAMAPTVTAVCTCPTGTTAAPTTAAPPACPAKPTWGTLAEQTDVATCTTTTTTTTTVTTTTTTGATTTTTTTTTTTAATTTTTTTTCPVCTTTTTTTASTTTTTTATTTTTTTVTTTTTTTTTGTTTTTTTTTAVPKPCDGGKCKVCALSVTDINPKAGLNVVVKWGGVQYNGKMAEAAGLASDVISYVGYVLTDCGAVLGKAPYPLTASASTCCDPNKYSLPIGVLPSSAKFMVVKAVTTAGEVDAGVKIPIVDAGGAAAGIADAACTAGAGVAAFAALAVAALV